MNDNEYGIFVGMRKLHANMIYAHMVRVAGSNMCFRCNGSFDPSDMSSDHIIPRGLGVSDESWNRQPLCLRCNSTKQRQSTDYRPEPFRSMLMTLAREVEAARHFRYGAPSPDAGMTPYQIRMRDRRNEIIRLSAELTKDEIAERLGISWSKVHRTLKPLHDQNYAEWVASCFAWLRGETPDEGKSA